MIYSVDKTFFLSTEDRYPISPFKYEKKISKDKGYIIDKDGIIWILTHMVLDDKDYGQCYYDGCLRECVTYIVMYDGYYNYLNVRSHIKEHLAPKEKFYNEFLGQYDNVGKL
jgi:hypothetical protein